MRSRERPLSFGKPKFLSRLSGFSCRWLEKPSKNFEVSKKQLLKFPKNNIEVPLPKKNKNAGRLSKIFLRVIRIVNKKNFDTLCITAKHLKKTIRQRAYVNIRIIQRICLEHLKLPCCQMVSKPLLIERKKNNRLEFPRGYSRWGVEQWKKDIFSNESHFELRFVNQSFRCRRPRGL
jgi:hypothetical protein